MLPSVCCLADARLVRLFPAVGRWGSPGRLAVLVAPATETKKPRNRLLGCVAKRWLAPRKVHAFLGNAKLLQQGRCRQEKPRKKASLCSPRPLTRWLGQKGRGILSQIVEPSTQLRFLPARESGTVGNSEAVTRGNCRPSVPTSSDSRAGGGEKGLFSPKTGTVGGPRAQKPGRRHRRSRFPARPGVGFTDGPRFPRGAEARLPSPALGAASSWASAATGNWRARKC